MYFVLALVKNPFEGCWFSDFRAKSDMIGNRVKTLLSWARNFNKINHMQPSKRKTIDYVTPKFEEWHGLKAGPSYVHMYIYLAPWKLPCQSSKKSLDLESPLPNPTTSQTNGPSSVTMQTGELGESQTHERKPVKLSKIPSSNELSNT